MLVMWHTITLPTPYHAEPSTSGSMCKYQVPNNRSNAWAAQNLPRRSNPTRVAAYLGGFGVVGSRRASSQVRIPRPWEWRGSTLAFYSLAGGGGRERGAGQGGERVWTGKGGHSLEGGGHMGGIEGACLF